MHLFSICQQQQPSQSILNFINSQIFIQLQQQSKLTKLMFQVFRNVNLVYSGSINQLIFQKHRCLIVNTKTGIIQQNIPNSDFKEEQFPNSIIQILKPTQILVPGMVDTHAHAPQFAFVGSGLDLPLLQWLQKYTFPCQAKFQDLTYARQVYQKSVHSHLKNGTTTISYFGTIHLQATKLLADLVEASGMRGFVGKVCMDQNSPVYYVQKSAEDSLADTKAFVEYLKSKNSSVEPVITPRFAPSCSSRLLDGLGRYASDNKLCIQTHLCQNQAQIAWVKQLFPLCSSYTDVYKQHNLLNKKTILAHCVYLNDEQIDMIYNEGAGISHCPNSNISLASGVMPARKIIDRGIKMGLGTDLAAGYSSSIFNSIRKCIGSSKIYHSSIDRDHSPVSLSEGFWLATRGGADLVGLSDKIGVLQSGYQFDALLIDYQDMDCFIVADDPIEEIFEKIVYMIAASDIKQIWVKGKKVKHIE